MENCPEIQNELRKERAGVLSPDDHELEIAPGDLLGGTFRVGMPPVGGIPFDCPEGDSRIVEVGDPVFAAFSPGSSPSRAEALTRGTLWLVPWEQPLRFGGRYEIDAASAGDLAERDICLEHFPIPPPRPCDDVAEVQSFTCSASPRFGVGTGNIIASVLVVTAAAALGRLRRCKRPARQCRPSAVRW
jgi:hypothetical protein